MDPIKRLSDLVELAKPRELPPSMTMEKCLQLLNEMHQMGAYYSAKGADEERAFVFYLRFISIVVEELPKNSSYLAMSQAERHALDVRALNCMTTAEQLKRRIKQRYEKEMIELAQQQSTSTTEQHQQMTASTSRTHSQPPPQQELDHLNVPDQHLCPYVRCHTVSMQPIVFQRVIIPNNIPELFLAQQQFDSNGGGMLRFALLYGRLVSKSVIVSQLLPMPVESISDRKNLRRFVPDSESGEDLPIVGCICSSLSMACQSGFFRACQISEMVCIVCAPGPNRTRILHLVNMSPSGGSPAHPSSMTSSGLPCSHQHITDSISAVILRSEHLQMQNGGSNVDLTQTRKSPASTESRGAIKTPLVVTKCENAGEELAMGNGDKCTTNGNSEETNG